MYNKYKSKEFVLAAIQELKRRIEPEYWTKDDKGEVVKNNKWIDDEFHIIFNVFNPNPDTGYDFNSKYEIIKDKGEQYTYEVINGERVMNSTHFEHIKKSFGDCYCLWRYLRESDLFPHRQQIFLKELSDKYDHILFDFIQPSYLELIQPIMSKLSANTTDKHCYSISERIAHSKEKTRLKKESRLNGTYVTHPNETRLTKEKVIVPYVITPKQSKQCKSPFRKKGDQKKLERIAFLKECRDKAHNKRILDIDPFKKVKPIPEGYVCVKEAKTGQILRVSKKDATAMMHLTPDQYIYTTKLKWRIQRDANREITANPSMRRAIRAGLTVKDQFIRKDGLRPRNKDRVEFIQNIPCKKIVEAKLVEMMNPAYYKDKTLSRTILVQQEAKTIVTNKSIRREIPNSTINPQKKKIHLSSRTSNLYLFKLFTNKSDTQEHHIIYKRCELNSKQAPGKFVDQLNKKWLKKKPEGKIMFSVIENTEKILPLLKTTSIVNSPKVIIVPITRTTVLKKPRIEKRKDGTTQTYYADTVTFYKVTKLKQQKTSTKKQKCKFVMPSLKFIEKNKPVKKK